MPEFERLPSNVVPLHYKIHIKPCLKTCLFSGDETITINVKTPTKSIQLHSLDIEIQSAVINNTEATSIDFSEENESVTLFFPEEITVGEHELTLIFTGEVNDKLKGFYRSTYHSLDGDVKTCAITQFEATDARRCFPCWDEPAIKASFTCSLTIPSHLLALSNMPVENETKLDENLKRLDFGKTPISPTYLVAFFVGEADYVEAVTDRGVVVRVYTPLGKKTHGAYAIQHAVSCIQFYEDYFKIDYPLPKMDMIALEDFCCGAMENWGLITYRATAILVDPEFCSTETKMYVSIVVAHEIAHQWFGNLVTMEWWTYLWLNEGFAEFMEYLCTDRIHPEYEMFKVFIKDDFAMGMELDALDSSHPVEVEVKHPDEVDEIFDYISYKKGASIIRMLHNWIGDKNFKKGMSKYLSKFAYSNTVTEDLWDCLQESSGEDVTKVMSTWVNQMGFPLVSFKRISATKIQLTQEKYSAGGPVIGGDYKWSIPISFCNSKCPEKPVKTVVMSEKVMEIEDECFDDEWVKVNPGTFGFYRVKYDSLPKFDLEKLTTADRLQLQSDVYALGRAGYAPLTDYFKVLNQYSSETEYTILADILNNLGDLEYILWNSSESCQDAYGKWKLQFLQNVKNSIGLTVRPNETTADGLLRARVITSLGMLGDQQVLDYAHIQFQEHITGGKQISGDLRVPVFKTVLAHPRKTASLDALLELWKQYSDLPEQQQNIERCLGTVASQSDASESEIKSNIQKIINFANKNTRVGNLAFVFDSLATSSRIGLNSWWSHVTENLEEFKTDKYPGKQRRDIVVKPLECFATEEQMRVVIEFYKSAGGALTETERAYEQALEKIKAKADCWKREGEGVEQYFG